MLDTMGDPPSQGDSDETFGSFLMSTTEPTITRQLNILSNIVKRAFLFGGDRELSVLAETLEEEKGAFSERWYGEAPPADIAAATSTIAAATKFQGVAYLEALIRLCRKAEKNGVIDDIAPLVPLSESYGNAYERLAASLVELGSGYIVLKEDASTVRTSPSKATILSSLVEFSLEKEARMRKNGQDETYPEDLVGVWKVTDEVGGKQIGISSISLLSEGIVKVDDPCLGLRWRLDPGPTHLDTVTFQIQEKDGLVLQYKGYIDRGARLEALYSRRKITVRGFCTFQTRVDGLLDSSRVEEYRKDILPIYFKTGTTRFVMEKLTEPVK